MSIHFFSEDISPPSFPESKIIEWVNRCITDENFLSGDINFIFVTDNYLLEMNKQYLNHDFYTDVITFDYCEKKILSGDIFISIPRIEENAHTLNQIVLDELFRVMIHGILHLMGYHDKTEDTKKQMRAKEDEALKKLIPDG